MQADKPKQYLALLGKTLLEHTLDIMLTHTAISKIILVVSKDDPYIANLSLSPKIQLVEGGETRAESVLNGLNAICDKNAWVLVHDAARPCLQHTDIDKFYDNPDPNRFPFRPDIIITEDSKSGYEFFLEIIKNTKK